MKKQILILMAIFSSGLALGQGNSDNWKTDGNTPQAGSFLGTLGNVPLNFRVNNTQKMVLDVNGDLNLANLSGAGNRVLLTDGSGKLVSLPAGSPGQYLQSDGSWASLPGGATSWSVSGNDLFSTVTGNIGIGTTNPLYKLDIDGSVRISSNLTVGGGIITTQQVDANGELNGGDVNVANTLSVGGISTFIGNALFNSDLTLGSNLYFGGQGSSVGINYTPSSGGNPPVFGWGGPFNGIPVEPDYLCFPLLSPGPTAVNQFGSLIQIYNMVGNSYSPGTSIFNIGANANESFLNSRYSPLTINKDCGQNLYVHSNQVGFGTSTPIQRYHFSNGNVLIDDNNSAGGEFRVKIKGGIQPGLCVNSSNANAFVIQDGNNNSTTNFKVKTNGRTYIGNPQETGSSMLTVAQPNKNELALSLVDNSNNPNTDFFNVYGNGYTEIKVYSPLNMPNNRALAIKDIANNKDLFVVKSDGKAYAREIEINLLTTFPDYVFSNEYELKSIEEVEKFIKKNNHLPGFEKGSYYEKNGINVNDMLVKQQEKIEELTLYIIQLEKKIKSVDSMERRIKAIENTVK